MRRRFVIAFVVIVAAGGALAARVAGFHPVRIESGSMAPAVEPGDWVVVRDTDRQEAGFERGDVLMFRFPFGSSGRAIKRVVAIAGDRVEVGDGSLTINGRRRATGGGLAGAPRPRVDVVPPGHVFLLGDNSAASIDSRSFGPVPGDEVVGRVVLTLPF
jgi:signal peptidase I